MSKLALPPLLFALLLAAACNPSLVKEGDPLHAYIGQEFFLARPLSGPKWRHPNHLGTPPSIDAGTKLEVVSIERSTPIYRIYFKGPEACRGKECMAHWRARDDASFKLLFDDVFRLDDPMAGLDAEVLKIIEAKQIASSMSPAEVRLALGNPNRIKKAEGSTRWIYERRHCDALGRLVAIPTLALIFEGKQLKAFEEIDAQEWYIVSSEPNNKLTGLCEGVQGLPEDTPVEPVAAGDMHPRNDADTFENADMIPELELPDEDE